MEFPNSHSVVLMMTSHCTNDAEGTEVWQAQWFGAGQGEGKEWTRRALKPLTPEEEPGRSTAQLTSFLTLDVGCVSGFRGMAAPLFSQPCDPLKPVGAWSH